MNPAALLFLAILTPFLLIFSLFVPPYAGIYGACYFVYNTGKAQPLADKYFDVFYIIDVYSQLLSYWTHHSQQVSFLHYTLPVVGLPLFCLLFALWFTRRLAAKMKDVFHLSVG